MCTILQLAYFVEFANFLAIVQFVWTIFTVSKQNSVICMRKGARLA